VHEFVCVVIGGGGGIWIKLRVVVHKNIDFGTLKISCEIYSNLLAEMCNLL
jgi:hypothetical protein